MVRDAFVRAVNDDGTIQIGHADPEGVYAERPIEIVTVSRMTALALIRELAQALAKGEQNDARSVLHAQA